MKIVGFLLLLSINLNCYAQNLQFFDREMIVKHKIKEIWEQISNTEKGGDDWMPCPNYYHLFDSKGNMVGEGMGRVPTTVGYKYNDKNEMVDIFWQDYRTKKIEHYFSSDYEDSVVFQEQLTETEERIISMLDSKESYSNHPKFKVSDSCAMINAEYILSVKDEKNGLPSFLKGNFKQELEGSPTPRKPVSPKQLYIYYVYEYFE
jgi:hypothetical protein